MTNSIAAESDHKKRSKRKSLTAQEKKWRIIAFSIFFLFMLLIYSHYQLFELLFNVNDWATVIVITLALVMPAYFTNAGMLVVGGGKPIDNGYICKDGRRLFGPGKTWRGFLLGPLLIGIPISLGIHALLYLNWANVLEPYISFMYGRPEAYVLFNIGAESALQLYQTYLVQDIGILIIRVIVISFSASIGDLLGSWIKRRLNKERGEPLWIVDQLDFVFVCLLFSLPFVPLDIFFLNIVIFSFLLSPTLTILANTLSYIMGIKSVPW